MGTMLGVGLTDTERIRRKERSHAGVQKRVIVLHALVTAVWRLEDQGTPQSEAMSPALMVSPVRKAPAG
jgi:hypothetical protein